MTSLNTFILYSKNKVIEISLPSYIVEEMIQFKLLNENQNILYLNNVCLDKYSDMFFFNPYLNTASNSIYGIKVNEKISGCIFSFNNLISFIKEEIDQDYYEKLNNNKKYYICISILVLFTCIRFKNFVIDNNNILSLDEGKLYNYSFFIYLSSCEIKEEVFALNLLKYDYYKVDLCNDSSLNYSEFKLKYSIDISDNIKINPINQIYNKSRHIVDLFLYDFETNELAKFLKLYQIVEILIEDVFESELNEIIISYKSSKINARKVDEKLKDLSKESYRVKKLSKGISGLVNFNKSIACLLNEKKQSEDTMANLYSLRCLLFHNYYEFQKNENHIDSLSSVNYYFKFFLIEYFSK